jgi:hypothetical protein
LNITEWLHDCHIQKAGNITGLFFYPSFNITPPIIVKYASGIKFIICLLNDYDYGKEWKENWPEGQELCE